MSVFDEPAVFLSCSLTPRNPDCPTEGKPSLLQILMKVIHTPGVALFMVLKQGDISLSFLKRV